MTRAPWFWIGLPLFIFLSGNFSPIKIGPVNPIYLLFFLYVIANYKDIITFFSKKQTTFLLYICYSLLLIFWSFYSSNFFNLVGDEFNGAINPISYLFFSYARLCLGLFFMASLYANANKSYKFWAVSITVIYWLLFISTFFQYFSHLLFGIEMGYIFYPATGPRYGGFIGEPQTLSAWLFCSFYVVFTLGKVNKRHPFGQALLIVSLLVSLSLTQSIVWFIATVIFFLINIKIFWVIRLLFAAMFIGFSSFVYEKIMTDIFQISERSITYIGGFEFFSANLATLFLGYGLGLSPYLLVKSHIFSLYPQFDLSDFGRQIVMNSYLEGLFELGIVGFILYLAALARVIGLDSWRLIIQISPILIGIISVGGGFVSGYFLLSIPLIVFLNKKYLSK
jgi:hypothetical protein